MKVKTRGRGGRGGRGWVCAVNAVILSCSAAFLSGCAGFVSGANSTGNPPTAGFSISGTINPATGGSGAMLALSGAASTTTTADSVGNYTFAGLANGTYTIAPSHAGFAFTPRSQST